MGSPGYAIAADLVLVVHFAFIVFVVVGGFLTWRWRWIAYLHVPAALWGAWVELAGWICPLTPLENRLRAIAGLPDYETGFIEHYLLPVIYPQELTRVVQIALGAGVIAVNVLAYGLVYGRGRWRRAISAPRQ